MEIRPIKWLALGLFLALSASIGLVALGRTERMAEASDELRDQPFLLADALLRAHRHIHDLQIRLRDMILVQDMDGVLCVQMRTTAEDAALAEALDLVVARHRSDEKVLTELIRTLSLWRETRERVAELLLDGRWQDASFLLNSEGEDRYRALRQALDSAMTAERANALRLRQEAERSRDSVQQVMVALAVLAGGALTATGLGLFSLMGTYRPLRRLRASLLALADGDTGAPIPYQDATSAIGALARAVACFRQSVIERDSALCALRLSEEKLRLAVEEADNANAAKSRFLAAASHDLRQPLQALRLYLDTLERRIDDRLDRRILGGALSALSAGEELLRNYLDVSVLEAGIVQPEMADVAVGGLLAELAAECGTMAEAKGLDMRVVPCGAVIRSDAALLGRLLRNLLSNAVRYTASGRVLLGCRRRGGFLRIEVWDTGIGIPPEQLDAVFEDFYQVDNPERDRTKGFGLGLSVVNRAARLLGHPVEVSSRPGRGSVFTVTVPLVEHRPSPEGTRAAA